MEGAIKIKFNHRYAYPDIKILADDLYNQFKENGYI